MTANFGNFVIKTDEKRKTKDEMKQTYILLIIFIRPNLYSRPTVKNCIFAIDDEKKTINFAK